MELRDRLESHPVTNLRKEISKKAKEIDENYIEFQLNKSEYFFSG